MIILCIFGTNCVETIYVLYAGKIFSSILAVPQDVQNIIYMIYGLVLI